MPDLDYSAAPVLGPRFYEEDGKIMFTHVVDRANVIGPREATQKDKDAHPDHWAPFAEPEPAPRRLPGRPRKT
jgi:hypothetical protein